MEFRHVIAPLTDPTAHGGKAEDAFHLILPSLPGYGFSGKPAHTGWGTERIAKAWTELMNRLGYGDHFVAQGGDWGSAVTTRLGEQAPAGLKAIHLNMAVVRPGPDDMADLTEAELSGLAGMQDYVTNENGYAQEQKTKPQTLGYALADSPVGQAAWIYEKFRTWSDCGDDPESAFGRDALLDNIMIYWLTNSGASSARLYWESFESFSVGKVTVADRKSVV